MINIKYEVDPTLELGYLGVKKNILIFENHEKGYMKPSVNRKPIENQVKITKSEHFLMVFPLKSVEIFRILKIFENFKF